MMRNRAAWILTATALVIGSLPAAAAPIVSPEVDHAAFGLPFGGDPDAKWGGAPFGTPGGNVSYSYVSGGTPCESLNFVSPCTTTTNLGSFLPAGYQMQVENAFNLWSSYGDIEFTNIADGGGPVNDGGAAGFTGDIRIGAYDIDGPSNVLAFAFFPYPADAINSARGDIFFDSAEGWEFIDDGTVDGAFNFFRVVLHEIGHSLGLDHAAGLGLAIMDPFYSESIAATLQADDIAGIQFIYGPQQGAIPEPATLTLVGLGLLGAGWAGRRRAAISRAR